MFQYGSAGIQFLLKNEPIFRNLQCEIFLIPKEILKNDEAQRMSSQAYPRLVQASVAKTAKIALYFS